MTDQAPRSHADWRREADRVRRPDRHLIGGEPRESRDGGTFAVVSPRDGAVLAEVSAAGAADVADAVTAARRAFDDGPWPRLAPAGRRDALLRLADLVAAHRRELALLVSLEMGKPISVAYGIELRAVIGCFRWYAELADKLVDEAPQVGGDALALVTREPAGVVGAVVPWNFPLTMAAWKLAPALAVGCTAVLKPAEQAPLSALRLAELAAEAGLPAGVLNVVAGDGPTAGRALGRHPGVDVLTFTGSGEVGRLFARHAAESNLKRVWLELGGKSPNIVLPDAPDLDAAARAAAWGVFFNSGQMCTAPSRLLVHRSVAAELVERVLACAAAEVVGDPLDPATTMGPLVSAEAGERVRRYVAVGQAEGARLRCGGDQRHEGSGGYYLNPTVFDQVTPAMTIAREEIFGPVLSVLVFDDVDEAVALANDSEYGLAAALWTADLGAAHRLSRRLRAGTVWVNCYEEGDLSVPFGGVKLSGYGRDKSRHALDKYTDLKTTWLALA